MSSLLILPSDRFWFKVFRRQKPTQKFVHSQMAFAEVRIRSEQRKC